MHGSGLADTMHLPSVPCHQKGIKLFIQGSDSIIYQLVKPQNRIYSRKERTYDDLYRPTMEQRTSNATNQKQRGKGYSEQTPSASADNKHLLETHTTST